MGEKTMKISVAHFPAPDIRNLHSKKPSAFKADGFSFLFILFVFAFFERQAKNKLVKYIKDGRQNDRYHDHGAYRSYAEEKSDR